MHILFGVELRVFAARKIVLNIDDPMSSDGREELQCVKPRQNVVARTQYAPAKPLSRLAERNSCNQFTSTKQSADRSAIRHSVGN